MNALCIGHWMATLLAAQAAVRQNEPPARYDGQKLVRVHLDSPRTIALLERTSRECWSHEIGVGVVADYRVSAQEFAALERAGVVCEVVIDDLQKPVDEERARLQGRGPGGRSWFDDFKPLGEVSAYCDLLAANHPGVVERQTVGHSIEGREIFALKISGPQGAEGKPALFFDATQHAREWISVSSVMYLADALSNGYGVDPQITELLDAFAVYIVPVANPDGYHITWTTDRYWRKNSRVVFDKVYGVDPNRNWGYKWGMAGSSASASSETYRGTAPFSEPETAAMRDYIQQIPGLMAAIDFHSYGQLVLSPWGYTPTPPTGIGSFTSVGNAMKAAILASRGVRYTVGICNTTLYATSGSAPDWFYGELNVPAWTIELTQGPFVIAPSAIVPTGKLTLAAVIALAEHVCPADIDGSGFMNGVDFDEFVAWFVAGDIRADYDRDTFLNGVDFDSFVDAFVRGCF